MSNTIDGPAGDVFVSTGELPGRELVEGLVHEAHARYRANRDGEISRSYPAVARVPVDRPFSSLHAVERSVDGRTNPMVNAGAIATTSLAAGKSVEDRWRLIYDGLSRFAGRELSLDAEVYASASGTNSRTQSIARLLESFDRVYCPSDDAVELYTRQCCLRVSARDLAVMGATLADGGVNPVTNEHVIDARCATTHSRSC